MSATLLSFAKYVRPEVPGCPDIQILDAILHAGIEFCERTREVRESVNVVTADGTASYALTVAAGTKPDEILSVKRSTVPLTPSSENLFFALRLDLPGTPNYFYLEGSNIVLGLKPTSVETLVAVVKTSPSEAATTLPDELYNRYRTEIASGAKAMLMVMKGAPWSDLKQAAVYASLFDQAITAANLRYARGASKTPLRTTAHFF